MATAVIKHSSVFFGVLLYSLWFCWGVAMYPPPARVARRHCRGFLFKMMNSTCWQAPDSPVSAGWAGPGAPSLSAEVLHQKFLQAADCLVGLEEQQDALLQEAGSVVFVRCVNQTLAPIQRQTAMHYFGVNGRILHPLGRRGGKGGARREPSLTS